MNNLGESRFHRAIKRNINEVGRAILNRKALVGLESAKTYHVVDFIQSAYWALFNDMFAHAMKVLDYRKGNASFWYIYRCKEKELNQFIIKQGIDLGRIEATSKSLLHIRDKTHFHIDRDGVKNPKQVWHDAGVKGNQLAAVIDDLWVILNHLYEVEFGEKFQIPDYDGSDATEIAKFAEKLRPT